MRLKPMNPPIENWSGQHVWIVGASSGIGAALARALVERGATVAVSARRAEALQAAIAQPGRADAASLQAAGHRILPLDITDTAALDQAHQSLRRDWGRIDLIVWMAAAWSPMQAQEFDLALAQRMLDINVGGVLKGLAVTLPSMIAQHRGSIVIVASVAGYRGLPMALIYGPTKAALINLAEALYLDLRREGLGVTLVAPGFVDTPLTATNDFQMPALISPEQAAREILAGLQKGLFEIHFPRRFTLWLKLLRILPYRWYFALVGRLTQNRSQSPRPGASP
jgi:short-subunit dehydrogenase